VGLLAQEQEMLAMVLRRSDQDVDEATHEAEGAHAVCLCARSSCTALLSYAMPYMRGQQFTKCNRG
jgi:hypothetical protein